MAVLWKETGREHVFHEIIPPQMSGNDRFLYTLLEYIIKHMFLYPNVLHFYLFTESLMDKSYHKSLI